MRLMSTSNSYKKVKVKKPCKCLTVVIVSLQVLIDVNASTAHFQVDAKLEETFVLTHQLC